MDMYSPKMVVVGCDPSNQMTSSCHLVIANSPRIWHLQPPIFRPRGPAHILRPIGGQCQASVIFVRVQMTSLARMSWISLSWPLTPSELILLRFLHVSTWCPSDLRIYLYIFIYMSMYNCKYVYIYAHRGIILHLMNLNYVCVSDSPAHANLIGTYRDCILGAAWDLWRSR